MKAPDSVSVLLSVFKRDNEKCNISHTHPNTGLSGIQFLILYKCEFVNFLLFKIEAKIYQNNKSKQRDMFVFVTYKYACHVNHLYFQPFFSFLFITLIAIYIFSLKIESNNFGKRTIV